MGEVCQQKFQQEDLYKIGEPLKNSLLAIDSSFVLKGLTGEHASPDRRKGWWKLRICLAWPLLLIASLIKGKRSGNQYEKLS